MFVTERFSLTEYQQDHLQSLVPPWGYNGFGEIVFYRTYSRIKKDGGQENFADCIIRVINGVISIRKDHYKKNHIHWDEQFWNEYAFEMACSAMRMEWLPGGRGMFAMGTDFVYEEGSMSLNNCGFTDITDNFSDDIAWGMDALMLGVGVGFGPLRNDDMKLYHPHGSYDFVIPDSREGWVESEVRLLDAYRLPNQKKPRFIYDLIRKKGLPIKRFGGISSGPDPLIWFHKCTEEYCERYQESKEYDSVRLKADLANTTGCCIVAGNVRRSAEKLKGKITDKTFLNLKNYELHPERENIGGMSNNSIQLEEDEDFEHLDEVALRIIKNGEPGFDNLRNFPFGRIGKKMGNLRKDRAKATNPCQPGWAKLLTRNGIREFNEISIGDEIWSEHSWTKVLNKFSTGINKVYKYTTTSSVFYGTENHKIVCDYFKTEVSKAYAIDSLVGPRNFKLLENEKFDIQTIMDGIVIGDGGKKDKYVLLDIGENDYDYFTSEIKQLIGTDYSKHDRTYRIRTTITQEEVPHTYLREIPERFIKAAPIKVASFLRGLYSANGSIVATRVTLKASSFKLIQQVQMMLSSLGIRSYWTKNKTKVVRFNNGDYECKESYDLQISGDRDLFEANIGFIQKYKNEKLKEIIDNVNKTSERNAKITYDIISVELISEEETFDITVEQFAHTYWTQGSNVSNCSEILLESRELCNLAHTFPTVCYDVKKWLKACEYATTYACTVSLLMTHQQSTNKIIARNRRIGISLADFTGWKHDIGANQVTKWMRKGYDKVRKIGKKCNEEAGIPLPIRYTTVQPGGTGPKLPGVTSGIGNPTFKETIRRINIAKNHPLWQILVDANISYEPNYAELKSIGQNLTDVFEYPILQGPAKPGDQVSIWEQAMNLILVQREWADNAVSNTLYFKPKWPLIHHIEENFEEQLASYIGMVEAHLFLMNNSKEYLVPNSYKIKKVFHKDGEIEYVDVHEYNSNNEEEDIESVLAAIAPVIKSVSVLPHSPMGAYKQMPEEGISRVEYERRLAEIKPINWEAFCGSDGEDEKYCSGPSCQIPK